MVFQTQQYDSLGKIEGVERYLEDGNRDLRPFPYIYINSPEFGDTLTFNRKYTLFVKVVNISDSLLVPDNLVLTNALAQNKLGRTIVADTLALVDPKPNFEYQFDFFANKEGDDRFVGLVYCKIAEGNAIKFVTNGVQLSYFYNKVHWGWDFS